jgi:hypothetical protein
VAKSGIENWRTPPQHPNPKNFPQKKISEKIFF